MKGKNKPEKGRKKPKGFLVGGREGEESGTQAANDSSLYVHSWGEER